MARPLALSASVPAGPIDLVRAAGVALVLAVLAVCVALPVGAVVAYGILPPVVWPLRAAAHDPGRGGRIHRRRAGAGRTARRGRSPGSTSEDER